MLAINADYLDFEYLQPLCDIISLHCPLNHDTHHIVNERTIEQMRAGFMFINTSRSGLADARAVITALKTGQIGYLGLDVYEEETDLFFENFSNQVLQDDIFARLQTFPNALITGHRAFFTREALEAIYRAAIANLTALEANKSGDACLVTKSRK